jgi:hypothetical protein
MTAIREDGIISDKMGARLETGRPFFVSL